MIFLTLAAEAPAPQKPQAPAVSTAKQENESKAGAKSGGKEDEVSGKAKTKRAVHGWAFFFSLTILVLLYYAISRMVPLNKFGQCRLNPLVLTAGAFGRGSLSKLQVFGFSLTVFWLLLYQLFAMGELQELPTDVLTLLGISAAGAGAGKITALTRKRLSFENWSWLKQKNWIEDSVEKPAKPARLRDLVTSDDEFDVYKFQMLAFSIVVGVALIDQGRFDLEPRTVRARRQFARRPWN